MGGQQGWLQAVVGNLEARREAEVEVERAVWEGWSVNERGTEACRRAATCGRAASPKIEPTASSPHSQRLFQERPRWGPAKQGAERQAKGLDERSNAG